MTSLTPPRVRVRTGFPALPARRTVVTVVPIGLLVILVVAFLFSSVVASLAVFTSDHDGSAVFGTKALFPGQRVTPAFTISDQSSGSAVDRTSPYFVSGDGLTATTAAWASVFSSSRYLEFDLNNSLPAAVAISTAAFDFRFASSGAGTACFYFEVRRISTGAVLATHGSSGSPVGCVTGTSPSLFSTSIASVVSTDLANDLRIRVFGRESGAASMVVDVATISGTTPYQSFVLAPIVTRDAASGTPAVIPWGLAVP